MMKYLAAFLLLTCSAASFAQAKSSLDPKRMAAIQDATDDRIRNQIDVWFERGDYPRCTQALRYLATAKPGDYDAQSDFGWMLENMEQYDEALAVYIHYRKKYPDQPDSAFPEAYFYFSRKAYSKVPPLLEPTISGKPHPNSYRLLAHSYERLGLLVDAKRTWSTLVRVHPEDDTAKANLDKVEKKINSQHKSAS